MNSLRMAPHIEVDSQMFTQVGPNTYIARIRFDPRIAEVLVHVDRRLSDTTLGSESLATAVGLSRSRLRTLFHQNVGITFKRYIIERRMSSARKMLSSTFLSVKQIMATVGFNDVSHFSREYKKRFALPPSQERKDVKVLSRYHQRSVGGFSKE